MRLPKLSDQNGSAPLEFIGFGLLLQLPLVPLVLQLASLQLEQLSAESMARNAIRAYCVSEVPIQSTIDLIAKDFNLPVTTRVSHLLASEGGMLMLQVSVGQATAIAVAVEP
ncbi:MAG: hypothetical protein RJB56_920 [Actinomycetota bacterium]|jgi:hypothetical protein